MQKENSSFTDKIIAGFKTLATELDHLRVQVALGKLEAKDLFEDLKKDLSAQARHMQQRIKDLKNDEKVLEFINAFEFLQVQLALGKAETAELFEKQSRKIISSISEIEKQVENNPRLKDLYSEFHFEIEKFGIRLQLIELHFKLNKIKTEYNFEEKKAEFMAGIDRLKEKLDEKERDAKVKFENFKTEIALSVEHLRKAFGKQ